MKDNSDKQDVQKIVDKAVTDLTDVIGNLAQSVHSELETIKTDNAEVKTSLNKLVNTIDGFVGRIDRYETEIAARDNQFNRLLDWAHKVSKKTGIPLENFK
jgi:predicted RecB family endonuclease